MAEVKNQVIVVKKTKKCNICLIEYDFYFFHKKNILKTKIRGNCKAGAKKYIQKTYIKKREQLYFALEKSQLLLAKSCNSYSL